MLLSESVTSMPNAEAEESQHDYSVGEKERWVSELLILLRTPEGSWVPFCRNRPLLPRAYNFLFIRRTAENKASCESLRTTCVY